MQSFPEIRSLADIEDIERQPYEMFVPANSVYDLIRWAAEQYGEKNALVYLPEGHADVVADVISYRDLFQKVTQAANLFHSIGVGAEDSVAILSPNIPEAHYALWGAETSCRACPVNFMLEVDHIVEILHQANARAVVALADDDETGILGKVKEISEKSGISDIYLIDRPDNLQQFHCFATSLQEQEKDRLLFDALPDRDSVAALFHTGGTTGVPKLAQHLHGNQLFTSYSAAHYYSLKSDDVIINGFPIFHVAGTLVYGTSCFTVGASQVLTTRTGYRNAELMQNIWKHVAKHKVTIFACVPTVMTSLVQSDPAGEDISLLRAFYTGGSPLPTELANAVEKKFSVAVRNIYGMTECAGLLSLEPFYADRTEGSAGYRLPFSDINAFAVDENGDVDFSEPCVSGETGVIAIRSPNVGPGYTDSKRNAGAFEDGWLISGDLGMVDQQGRVFITGREKDVIIRGAHNIDPASIEDAVNSHPAISICAAIGQPDSYAGEIPVVYAELKVGKEATSEDVRQYAAPRISEPAARPKRIEFVDQLPKTAVGKIFKPTLRCRAAEFAFGKSLEATDFNGRIAASLEGSRIVVKLYINEAVTEEQMSSYKHVLQNYSLSYDFIQGSKVHAAGD